jgi:hypothetical protein
MRARFRFVLAAFVAAFWGGSIRAQQAGDAPAADSRMLIQKTIRTNVGGLLVQGTFVVDSGDEDDPETRRRQKQVTLSVANFDEAVYRQTPSGPTPGPDQVRQRLAALLARKLGDVERLCQLTHAQRQKLELAGRGDRHRLFERVEEFRLKSRTVCEPDDQTSEMDTLLNWAKGLLREVQPLKVALASDPFGVGSLFSKTLAGMISPAQLAEFRQQQATASQSALSAVGAGLPAPLTPAERDARLAIILAEWEKASSKVERLDCQFLRFKYDRTFEVEWRGRGSLAIEKLGRAMYQIGPDAIQPGAVGNKRGTNGVLYELKSEAFERWHWTGNKVIKVSEKERTYEELSLAKNEKTGEFQPEPPALPEEAAPSEEPPRRKDSDAPAKQRQRRGEGASLGELVIGVAGGVVVASAASKIDWAGVFEAIGEFPLARPFLLGMNAADLTKRFQVDLKQETDTEIRLEFIPKREKDRAMISKTLLILSKDRYQPVAIKTVDPTGAEIVHVFKDVKINPRGPVESLEQPNLRGYRRVLNEVAAPERR